MSLNRKEADGTTTPVAGIPYVTKENIGLSKVENKSSEEIRGEITAKNIKDALGYTPANDADKEEIAIEISNLKFNEYAAKCINNASVVSELLDVCDTYYNHNEKLYYGHYSAVDYNEADVSKGIDENGRAQIDCSSFIELVLAGIRYESSRYVIKDNLYVSNYCYHPYLTQEEAKGEWWADHRLSYEQAKLAYEKGYCFKPNYDFTNVQPGDVVFLYDNNTPSETQWMGIDHVMLYLGRMGDKDDLHFYECGGNNANMLWRDTMGVVHQSRRSLAYMLEHTIMVARFPLGNGSGNDKSVIFSSAFPSLPLTFSNEEKTQYFPCEKINAGEWYTVIARVNAKNGNPFFSTDVGHLLAKTSIECPTILINTLKAKNDFSLFRIGSYNKNDEVTFYDFAIVRGYCNCFPRKSGKYSKIFRNNLTLSAGVTQEILIDFSNEPITINSFAKVHIDIGSEFPQKMYTSYSIKNSSLYVYVCNGSDEEKRIQVVTTVEY